MSPVVAVILMLATFPLLASAELLPCSLRWKPIDTHVAFAKDWVPVNHKQHSDLPTEYLVRVGSTNLSETGKYTVLSIQPPFNQNMKSKLHELHHEFEYETIFDSYDILTNPHECKLSWESCQFSGNTLGIQKRAYYVKVSPEDETYVARKYVESDATEMYPDGSRVLPFVKKDSNDPSVRCLKSIKGGIANFTQFVFSENKDNDVSQSMLGLDRIDNQSEATIIHTIDHRKRFSETFEFTETHSWEHLSGWSLSIGVSAKFPLPTQPPITVGIDVSLTFEHIDKTKESKTNSTYFAKEREVISSRSVILDEYSSVQACSISSFQNKLKLNYKAKARHTAPSGTSVKDVEIMLTNVGYDKLKTQGKSVIVDTQGALEGSLTMQSSFIVTELGAELSCGQLPEKFRQLEELRSRIKNGDHNALAERIQIENDILRVKNGPRVTAG